MSRATALHARHHAATHGGTRWKPLALATVALVALAFGVLMLRDGGGDPMPEMAGMPFAFITEEDAGYDPVKVILWRGGSQPPRSLTTTDGRTAWPAYLAEPAFVPTQGGARWIFPMVEDEHGQHSPPLPPRGKRVSGSTPGFATPYLAPEAEEMLAGFRQRSGR